MKILRCEPEEIINPQKYLALNEKHPLETKIAMVALTSALRKEWGNGKQAVLAQVVDVDDARFDELIINWLLTEVGEIGEVASGKIIVKGKRPSEYLKEQLEKHETKPAEKKATA